jgi:hypothetical protein
MPKLWTWYLFVKQGQLKLNQFLPRTKLIHYSSTCASSLTQTRSSEPICFWTKYEKYSSSQTTETNSIRKWFWTSSGHSFTSTRETEQRGLAAHREQLGVAGKVGRWTRPCWERRGRRKWFTAPRVDSFREAEEDDEAERLGLTAKLGVGWNYGARRRPALGFRGARREEEKDSTGEQERIGSRERASWRTYPPRVRRRRASWRPEDRPAGAATRSTACACRRRQRAFCP